MRTACCANPARAARFLAGRSLRRIKMKKIFRYRRHGTRWWKRRDSNPHRRDGLGLLTLQQAAFAGRFRMVEMRGIEPLSETALSGFSTWLGRFTQPPPWLAPFHSDRSAPFLRRIFNIRPAQGAILRVPAFPRVITDAGNASAARDGGSSLAPGDGNAVQPFSRRLSPPAGG